MNDLGVHETGDLPQFLDAGSSAIKIQNSGGENLVLGRTTGT